MITQFRCGNEEEKVQISAELKGKDGWKGWKIDWILVGIIVWVKDISKLLKLINNL